MSSNTSSGLASTRRNGIVTPIFKKGSKSKVENCRPVTLLDFAGKILERCIYIPPDNCFIKFVSSQHFGFQSRKSTNIQLLNCLHQIHFDNADSKKGLIFFEFAKAFEKVTQKLLVTKLSSLALQKSMLAVITNYLQNRHQAVRVNDHISSWAHVLSGVPQESLLATLLFLIFINDLPDFFFSTAYLFADDLELYTSTSESDRLDLSQDIDAMMEWISTNQMQLNISKCQFLLLLSSRHEPNVLDTITLTPSRLVNDLDLKIESNLIWATHIKHCNTKANRAYQIIRRNISPSLPSRSKLNVFKSSILPIGCYANQCWCPSKSSVAELKKYHQRIMTWILPYQNYQSAFIILNVLPLPYYMVLMDCLTLSGIINNEYELNWQSHCKLNQSTSTTNTRGTLFHLHTITKESQRSDSFYRTCKIVNRMDKHVNFMETRGLKGRLLKCFWKVYNDHYDISNTCTWYPNCGCVSCKLNPKQF